MKKVLASVLAGSMVLGMASMASAAPSLVKGDKTSDYDFRMVNVYEGKKGAEFTKYEKWEDVLAQIPAAVLEAYNAYEEAYDALDTETGKVPYDVVKAALTTYKAFYVAASAEDDSFADDAAVAAAITEANFVAEYKKAAKKEGLDVTVGNSSGATAATIAGTAKYGRSFVVPGLIKGPAELRPDIIAAFGGGVGTGRYGVRDGETFELKVGGDWYNLYNFGKDGNPDRCDEVKIQIPVQKGHNFRVDVNSGDVTVTRTKTGTDKAANIDFYVLKIKAAADIRDHSLDDFKVEVELEDADIIFFIKGKVAYSDYQEVTSGDNPLHVSRSEWDGSHDHGCIFKFADPLDEEVRIICEKDFVDVMLKGNYGTDYENMRVVTDNIKEVEDFFQDYDIDYYDFIGLPKFAKDVTVRVDADSDSYIYEFDKKTGDVVDITDECDYTSNGWTFKRKSLKTYVVLEEPYEGGNVRAEKEPVDDEPTEPDDTDATGSKPNPGTGAMPF